MELLYALLAAVSVSLIALIGIFIIPKKWDHSIEQRLLGFAAGVLVAAAALQLLPEAAELDSGQGPYYALLAGIIGFFILERLFRGFHSHNPDDSRVDRAPGYLVIIGDGIHNLIDGIAIGIAFQVNPALGVATALAVGAHEIPQEIADFIVLLKSGFSRRRALLLNFASGLTALVGVILSFAFGNFIESYQGMILALTAGLFLYIAAADIIPEINHTHPTGSKYALPLLGGVLLVAALTVVLPGA